MADDSKNAILMEATLADYRRLMKVINTLDVVPNQVMIDATIAEITLNDDLKFGVRWSLQGKLANYSFTDDAGGALSSVFPGFSYAVKAANIAGSLNALNAITNVNVISSPSLTVAANKTAMHARDHGWLHSPPGPRKSRLASGPLPLFAWGASRQNSMQPLRRWGTTRPASAAANTRCGQVPAS